MAFQQSSLTGDVQNRRSILQGLQQTRSRLQRMTGGDGEPQATPRSGSTMHTGTAGMAPPLRAGSGAAPPLPSHLHTLTPPTSRPSPTSPQLLANSRIAHTSPSPNEHMNLAQQQKLALQQAHSQSFGYFISQPSPHGNLILPVLPRFDSAGQLIL